MSERKRRSRRRTPTFHFDYSAGETPVETVEYPDEPRPIALPGAGGARRVLRLVLCLAAAVLLLAGAVFGLWHAAASGVNVPADPARANRQTAAAKREPHNACPVDFAALQARNPDVVGWISAPQLGIEQPILLGEDNEEYLRTTIDGNYAVGGSIFLDHACGPGMDGDHVVIYGHNTHDGGMFSNLELFKDRDAFDRLRDDITIWMPGREIRLRVVAAEADPSRPERRLSGFPSRQEFLDYALPMLDACTIVDLPDRELHTLFSFITCSYEGEDYRTYVYAVEIDQILTKQAANSGLFCCVYT